MSQHVVEVKCRPDGKAFIHPIVNECLIYSRRALDTHHGYDSKKKIYTFPAAGKFLIKEAGDVIRVIEVGVGDQITDPDLIIGEGCVHFSKDKLLQEQE